MKDIWLKFVTCQPNAIIVEELAIAEKDVLILSMSNVVKSDI